MNKLLLVMFAICTLVSCSKGGDDPDPTYYTVTFNADGGTPAPANQSIEKGKTATAPTSPTKTGYVFLFWHLNDATTAYNFQSPVNKNITLQAKWEAEAVAEYWQVTWNLNDGTWPSGDNHATQVAKGGTLAEPAAPTKAGKVFDGWYKEAGLTNKINFPYNVSAVTANFTLYAKWADPAVEHWQITWELNGGAWPSVGDNHVTQIEKGTTLAEPAAPVKDGNTFEGWYKEAALTNKISFPYTVTADLKLFAKWSIGGGDGNRNISNAAEWNAAIAAVNAAGNDKTHTFIITQSFALPGITTTLFTKELSGIEVTIKGKEGNPVPTISLAESSTGCLIYLLPHEPQTVILENIILKGHANNTSPVVELAISNATMIMNGGSAITGNTNKGNSGTVAYGGGAYVSGNLIMRGGEITNNRVGGIGGSNKTGRGGGVYMPDMGDLIMESGSIKGNIAFGQGGGVYIGFSATFALKGGLVSGNTAWATTGARGGGVYNSYGNFYISGGRINGYDVSDHNVDSPQHRSTDPEIRDECNAVIITPSAQANYGATFWSQVSSGNLYGVYEGDTFVEKGTLGGNGKRERDITVVDGVFYYDTDTPRE